MDTACRTTHPSNANKQPRNILLALQKKKRTPTEMEVARQKDATDKVAKESTKSMGLKRIAAIQDRMAQEDAAMSTPLSVTVSELTEQQKKIALCPKRG
jgi:hypothetical protein